MRVAGSSDKLIRRRGFAPPSSTPLARALFAGAGGGGGGAATASASASGVGGAGGTAAAAAGSEDGGGSSVFGGACSGCCGTELGAANGKLLGGGSATTTTRPEGWAPDAGCPGGGRAPRGTVWERGSGSGGGGSGPPPPAPPLSGRSPPVESVTPLLPLELTSLSGMRGGGPRAELAPPPAVPTASLGSGAPARGRPASGGRLLVLPSGAPSGRSGWPSGRCSGASPPLTAFAGEPHSATCHSAAGAGSPALEVGDAVSGVSFPGGVSFPAFAD